MFNGEISGVYRGDESSNCDNPILDSGESGIGSLWQVGAGIGMGLGDMVSVSIGAAMGEGPATTSDGSADEIVFSLPINNE